MTKKVKATKTINPLHFEDLEPHRFEDLVRRLLYGFRDWSNIEATGRAGSDEGFDVRAWEKTGAITNVGDQGEEGARDLEGRLWQIQGKREKTISPGKIRGYIQDGVDEKHPPYGYILAAATNISKAAYDAFREELRKKGVTEFFFWGKDYLEDQLALPQHDEVLFTFFGLSLSPRRKSLTSEIKFGLNNKNKILKLFFGNEDLRGQPVRRTRFLLRDIKAEHYPYQEEYPDFEKHRRWEEHDAVDVTARGLMFHARERYAYFDHDAKEWDFTPAVDLVHRKQDRTEEERKKTEEERKKAERFWRHLPRKFQAKIMVYGFVSFDDMLIIDDKGDTKYTDPHIFLDFGAHGPFQYVFANLFHRRETFHESEFRRFKKVPIFPEHFPELVEGRTRDLNGLGLRHEYAKLFEHLTIAATIYSFGSIKDLSVNDRIQIPKDQRDRNSYDKFAEVTHVYQTTAGALLKEFGEYFQTQLKLSAGKQVAEEDEVTVYELHEVTVLDSGNVIYSNNSWEL